MLKSEPRAETVPKATLPEAVVTEPSVPFGKRLKSLDGVRGLAILLVIAFHALRMKPQPGVLGTVWEGLQDSSWAGVDLFFVLSGFLITGILLDSKSSAGYFRNFYARRTLRIFPLYYAVLVVALLVVPRFVNPARIDPLYPRLLDNQIWLWTYLQNYIQSTGSHTLPGFGHFWSLAVEEQFYWFWPLVVYATSRKNLLRICLVICAVEPLLRFGLLAAGQGEWAVRQYTFTRVDSLLYGAIVAILVRDGISLLGRKFAIAAVAAAAAVVAVIVARNGYVPYEFRETVVIGYSALGILFSAFIYHCATKTSRVTEVLSGPFLRWFGKYSYAIYVLHWPVTQAYQRLLQPRMRFGSPYLAAIVCFLLVTLVSSGIAVASWYAFESHFLKLKRFFEYRPKPATASA